MIVKIPMTRGSVMLMDDADVGLLAGRTPRVHASGYVVIASGHSDKVLFVHRLITAAPRGRSVDHIDGNPLNNTRANLRLCSHGDNMKNRKRHKNAPTKFKGVQSGHAGKWYARIRFNTKSVHLGTFIDPEEAARAYDTAAKQYFGPYARLNFPDQQNNLHDVSIITHGERSVFST